MSPVGVNFANTEYDAAQALLDLQSNIRDTKSEKYGETPFSHSKESVETAKLFLSCFISSNVAQPPVKPINASQVGTVNPIYADTKNTKIATAPTHTPKMKASTQQLPSDSRVNVYHSEESSNKRSKIFKRKPSKHFTVTSSPFPDIIANKITYWATTSNLSNYTEPQEKTRDVGTQTDEKYQLPIIETMEFTIATLCEKIESLEAQMKSNLQRDTTEHHISENEVNLENYDNNESYKALDDGNAFDSDMDHTLTDCDIPENVKSKHRVSQYHGHNSTKVLSNRNINANADDMVPIGLGSALIPSRIFRHINWNSYTSATRKLLTAVFSRRILATHCLTGKPSPAFPKKPAKKKLDQAMVNDIVQTVVERCCVPENVVRTSITTKCADESKMFRTRQQNKKKRKHKVNRENIAPDSDSDEFY